MICRRPIDDFGQAVDSSFLRFVQNHSRRSHFLSRYRVAGSFAGAGVTD
jgi:hypothetical protein